MEFSSSLHGLSSIIFTNACVLRCGMVLGRRQVIRYREIGSPLNADREPPCGQNDSVGEPLQKCLTEDMKKA